MKKALITAPVGTILTAIAEGKQDTMTTPDESTMQFEHDELVVSDGYHTFDELYDHRITLFIALARLCRRQEIAVGEFPGQPFVWRSKKHSDGELCFGTGTQYVLGIGNFEGQQITYHIPVERWDETEFAATLEVAPKWDGHSSADVLERLKGL